MYVVRADRILLLYIFRADRILIWKGDRKMILNIVGLLIACTNREYTRTNLNKASHHIRPEKCNTIVCKVWKTMQVFCVQ